MTQKTVPVGNMWGDSSTNLMTPVGVTFPGAVDPSSVPEGDMWGEAGANGALSPGVGAPGLYDGTVTSNA